MGEDFVKVAETEDVQVSQMMAVEVNDEKICLANVNGKYYAIGNVCTHMGGPLAEGKLEEYIVQCPWHGSRFDIRSGEVVRPPAMKPESTYEVKVENNDILIKKQKENS
ncbi:MAG: bphF [Nitrososphaeraceae archaeon]|jgi:nitrite reductase/ring-hydroxylating ferredoxin subunit|nr:bphF [Nitrososphaeraceae archaeon]MCD6037570.1 bphF [Nitrososphaeraceae archaeon]MDF2769062.1 bphF [Nitrososphaeraceae archaeon]